MIPVIIYEDTRRSIVFHSPLNEYLPKLAISVKDVAMKWCVASLMDIANFGKMHTRGRRNYSRE
jgi:hypothetical protein